MEPLSPTFELPNILTRKMMCKSKKKLEDLILLIVRNHLPMHLVESQWLKRFSLHLCPKVVFPFIKNIYIYFCYSWWEKNKNLYILPTLIYFYFVTSFDMWMSKGAYDIFALVIKFLGAYCQPKHIAIGLFEASNTSRHALAKDLT
jgi:hypothetical protein